MSDVWENYSYADAFVTFEDRRSRRGRKVSKGLRRHFTVDAPAGSAVQPPPHPPLRRRRHVAARATRTDAPRGAGAPGRPRGALARDRSTRSGQNVRRLLGRGGQSYAGRSSTRVGLPHGQPRDRRNLGQGHLHRRPQRGRDRRERPRRRLAQPVAEAFRGLGAYLSDAFTSRRGPAPCRVGREPPSTLAHPASRRWSGSSHAFYHPGARGDLPDARAVCDAFILPPWKTASWASSRSGPPRRRPSPRGLRRAWRERSGVASRPARAR